MQIFQKKFRTSPSQTQQIFQALFEAWVDATPRDESLEIRRLGTWQWRRHGPKKGRLPFKPHPLIIKTRLIWHYKPSATLIQKLNRSTS